MLTPTLIRYYHRQCTSSYSPQNHSGAIKFALRSEYWPLPEVHQVEFSENSFIAMTYYSWVTFFILADLIFPVA